MKSFAIAFGLGLLLFYGSPVGAAGIVVGNKRGDKAKLQISKASSDPGAHQIQYFAQDPEIVFTPGAGATDDPPTNGAAAVIFSATDCQCITLAPAPVVLPGWAQVPSSGTPAMY